jgi:phenylalanyl-tRNA synthetase alpha chain
MQLPEAQVALLEAASATESKRIDQLATETELKPETVTQAAFELEDDGLLDVTESAEESVELTDEGREYADAELPEVTLYRAAIDAGADDDAASMGQIIGASGLEGGAVDIALALQPRRSSSVRLVRHRAPNLLPVPRFSLCSYLDYSKSCSHRRQSPPYSFRNASQANSPRTAN